MFLPHFCFLCSPNRDIWYFKEKSDFFQKSLILAPHLKICHFSNPTFSKIHSFSKSQILVISALKTQNYHNYTIFDHFYPFWALNDWNFWFLKISKFQNFSAVVNCPSKNYREKISFRPISSVLVSNCVELITFSNKTQKSIKLVILLAIWWTLCRICCHFDLVKISKWRIFKYGIKFEIFKKKSLFSLKYHISI